MDSIEDLVFVSHLSEVETFGKWIMCWKSNLDNYSRQKTRVIRNSHSPFFDHVLLLMNYCYGIIFLKVLLLELLFCSH
jgi:hypothetical protein